MVLLKAYRKHSIVMCSLQRAHYNKTQFDVCCSGTTLVLGSADGSLYVYDCHTTRLRKRHSFSVPSIAVQCHPTISSLVTCSLWDGSIATLNFI